LSEGAPENRPLRHFAGPRYWPLWPVLGLLRLTVLLPARARWALGRGLGNVLRIVLAGRRRVAATNLALCFPAATAAERAGWLVEHFHSLGMAPLDLAMAAWASPDRILALVQVTGMDNLVAARAAGRGVILLTGHFPAAELGGFVLQTRLGQIAALYRPTRNGLVDAFLRLARDRGTSLQIPKDSMRSLVRALRSGHTVYFAPDQSHRRQHSALLPFFGEPAMTNTALTAIVRLTGALVVPMATRRSPDGLRYEAVLLPALADFPGASETDDARRVITFLEEQIRLAPAQYYWIHRRFKGRPAPWPDPYAGTPSL
jgi:KDO2-lipid IV(A) lauroyltransferase